MEQALTWIGFTNDANRAALRIDIAEFEDMLELSEKDISDLEYSYSKRTVGDGRFIFGLQRTKRVKAMIHWVHSLQDSVKSRRSKDSMRQPSGRPSQSQHNKLPFGNRRQKKPVTLVPKPLLKS